ncbi:MAG: flagellar biosynthesis protein FlhA [Armatimonadetes bacterium]|nr:flagellar biosynthesis protein FlhA [Armatimonadota bacterium]
MNNLQKLFKYTDLAVGLGMLVIVAMLILPLPTWALDAGLVAAISASVIILLTSVNITDPLQLSVFPSLLLMTTLFRLSLSIAATKLILGTGQGGHVIQTFGDFVMGGDFVVGFVAFLILMIVQFIVITNGAGRVAEVVARFTLDAMPGKQMAIDADLAAGLIDDTEARARRKQIKAEADFYGAMDGASKFVKGDAIAALLIIIVNIVGGFIVGYMRGDGDPMSILRSYALLSVGEGLVSQLPALLISTASGLMVTRASQDKSMGSMVVGQFLDQPKAIGVAGIALAALAFVPGFPATIFMGAAALCFGGYRFLSTQAQQEKVRKEMEKQRPVPQPTGPESVLPLLNIDAVEIEVGYGLTRMADPKQGGDLVDRITATRRQIALDLGFVMPSVRIRDSIHLGHNEYLLKIRGEEVAKAESRPDQLLAVGGGMGIPIPGFPTKEPVFGLDAIWIDAGLREQAVQNGYTVIEPSAVISTHLAEIVKRHAAELLSRQDVQTLIDNAKNSNKAVVEELVPGVLNLGDIQKVLQHLLRERVPIRDMVTILETMADFAARVKDTDQLSELVRSAIARTITRQYLEAGVLHCITLDSALERSLTEKVQTTAAGPQLMLDPTEQRMLLEHIQQEVNQAAARGQQGVLLCSTTVRLPLRKLIERQMPNLNVLAYNEVSAQAEVEFVGQVRQAA